MSGKNSSLLVAAFLRLSRRRLSILDRDYTIVRFTIKATLAFSDCSETSLLEAKSFSKSTSFLTGRLIR